MDVVGLGLPLETVTEGIFLVNGGRMTDCVGIGWIVIMCGVEYQTTAATAVLELELELEAVADAEAVSPFRPAATP